VAQAYLPLADPEDEDGRIRLSESKDAFAPGARVSLAEWSRTMKGAHLASAAIRLASIDEVLDRANDGRALYQECRKYFRTGTTIADDPPGSSCPVWFHVIAPASCNRLVRTIPLGDGYVARPVGRSGRRGMGRSCSSRHRASQGSCSPHHQAAPEFVRERRLRFLAHEARRARVGADRRRRVRRSSHSPEIARCRSWVPLT
jgi:hypothetical protein